MTEGTKACGSGFAYETPREGAGRRSPKASHAVSEGAGLTDGGRLGAVKGVNRSGGASERGHLAGEAVQLLGSRGRHKPPVPLRPAWLEAAPNRRSACEMHDPTGEPDAGNPHVPVRRAGGGNGPMGVGLSTAAKASGSCAPYPKGTAPPPDPTHVMHSRPAAARTDRAPSGPTEDTDAAAGSQSVRHPRTGACVHRRSHRPLRGQPDLVSR